MIKLVKVRVKLVDIDGTILKNFPVKTGYKDKTRFSEKRTNNRGMLEFEASPNRILEIQSINLEDQFIPLGYFSSDEIRVCVVKHKFKVTQFISKTTAYIVDIDGSHIYPNVKLQTTYNGTLKTMIVKDGKLNVATYIGYPIEFLLYKPDNTPLHKVIYVAPKMKLPSGFEIRVPVNLTSGTTNPNKPQGIQNAPTGLNSFITLCIPLYTGESLSEQDYFSASIELDCEIEAIKAVAKVESPRGGFQSYLGVNMPSILYERHYFMKFTSEAYNESHPKLSGTYGAKHGKYSEQYAKLLEAMALNESAALKSCSWGRFQIMGANHVQCGYSTVKDMVKDAFIRALLHKPIMQGLFSNIISK